MVMILPGMELVEAAAAMEEFKLYKNEYYVIEKNA